MYQTPSSCTKAFKFIQPFPLAFVEAKTHISLRLQLHVWNMTSKEKEGESGQLNISKNNEDEKIWPSTM
jgi:hypothetical protein